MTAVRRSSILSVTQFSPDETNHLLDNPIGIPEAMRSIASVWGVSLVLILSVSTRSTASQTEKREVNQRAQNGRQLAAVRGEVTKIAPAGKGMLLITVRPAKDFQEVTVLARENDFVGTAVGRSGEPDLLGLLSDDSHDDETITAAELNEGDLISVIYDPHLQNKALEIYLH